jgi:CheY-like chemotaxis protein
MPRPCARTQNSTESATCNVPVSRLAGARAIPFSACGFCSSRTANASPGPWGPWGPRCALAGHSVVAAGGVRAADEAFAGQHFDIAVVDLGFPTGPAWIWCRATRTAGSDVPILLLTARNGVPDRVAGLDAGADDYLGKPFSIEELVARVGALARRGPRWTESVRHFGPMTLDRDRRLGDGRRIARSPDRARV